MSIMCKNGPVHSHETVTESKICWGIISRPVAPPPAAPPLPALATQRQLDYIKDLGGDPVHAAKLTREQASKYIDRLKAGAPATRRPAVSEDPRLAMVRGLIERVPIGYYAVQKESGAPIKFIRLSRPKVGGRNRFAGALKIQTQHGPRLEEAGALWPGGQWSIWNHELPEMLLLLVSDHRRCNKLYAQEIGRCMRCNAELTDDRSRHYGIGPECEQKMGYGWVIEERDEEQGASFESLRARGLINLTS